MTAASGRYQAAMRALFALAALPLLTTFAPAALFVAPAIPPHPEVALQPVALYPEAETEKRIGGLRYLGGWVLESDDPRFGGISAVHVENRRVTAVSDAGALIRFALPDRGPSPLKIGFLPESGGAGASKLSRDSESLVIDGDNAWIGFEHRNGVGRYRRGGEWHREAITEPDALDDWPDNMGPEAMVRLADGTFLVFSEGERLPSGATEVLLFEGDPAEEGTRTVRLGYRAPEGFHITDAALLPDGRVMFLNRRFTLLDGFSAKLTISGPLRLNAGRVLSGREIATFEAPAIVDNMEALSVTRDKGRTIVWIASDDNFSALQRTLLLKFELIEPAR